MNCPQNLIINGLSSNKFNLNFNFFYNLNNTFINKINNEINEETTTLFILSILNELIENIGDTFTIIIDIDRDKKTYSNIIYNAIMTIILPNMVWINDFGQKISTLLNNIDKDIVTINNSKISIKENNWICNQKLPLISFNLTVKNGIYILKKKEK